MSISLDRVPPQNIDAEMSVLGACLIDRDALSRVAETITDINDFYKTIHQTIYEAILRLFEKGEPVDLITLTNTLTNSGKLEEVGGVEYLSSLIDRLPTVSNVESYANIVKEKALLRTLIIAGMNIVSLGYKTDEDIDLIIDSSEQEIFKLSQKHEVNDFVPISGVMMTAFSKLEELYSRQANVTGLPSGLIDLDRLTTGFQKGNLIIVAARPSMGKTALCLNIAQHVALREKIGVAIFSLEMPKEDLAMRFLCSEARIDGQKIKTGHLQESDWPRLARAMNILSEAPIFIDDSGGVSVMEVRSRSRRLKSKNPNIGLIIIDYLQMMKGNALFKGDRNREISEISRQLKSLAKELNIPIIALSQLNRGVEARQDKRPMLSDLRESGSIEQDADLVMFIYRDIYYDRKSDAQNTSELIIAKHRNGPVGTINLLFLDQYATFVSADKRYLDGNAP